MPRPATDDYAPFYANYVSLVPGDDILAALDRQTSEFLTLINSVSEETSKIRHAPYTWSVREVLGHLNDGERVFGYRALCLARGDTQPLPGFDETAYAATAGFDTIPFRDLAAEFDALRRANTLMLKNLPKEAWTRRGTVWNNPITMNAQAYILAGHVQHHFNILKKRVGQA